MRTGKWLMRQQAEAGADLEEATPILQPRRRHSPPKRGLARAEARGELTRALARAAHPKRAHASEPIEIDEETAARLRALGYTNEAQPPSR
jgi:hypothetical protein